MGPFCTRDLKGMSQRSGQHTTVEISTFCFAQLGKFLVIIPLGR